MDNSGHRTCQVLWRYFHGLYVCVDRYVVCCLWGGASDMLGAGAYYCKAGHRKSLQAIYMGIADKQADDATKVNALIGYLRKMNDDLKIPHCIKNYGADSYPTETGFVPENVFLDRLHDIAVNAIGDACTGSNPRQPSVEEMEKLLKCCYYDTEVDF